MHSGMLNIEIGNPMTTKCYLHKICQSCFKMNCTRPSIMTDSKRALRLILTILCMCYGKRCCGAGRMETKPPSVTATTTLELKMVAVQ